MARRRDDHEAGYVLELIGSLLDEPSVREHRFDWLRGDPGKSGRTVRLPVDAYWPDRALVVEVYERQHDEAVTHFDKPDRLTVSGVHRGEQRRLHDERRRTLVPAHGLALLIVRTSQLAVDARGRLVRDVSSDDSTLRTLVEDAPTFPGRVHESTPA